MVFTKSPERCVMDCPKCGKDYYEEFEDSAYCFGCSYKEVYGTSSQLKGAELRFHLEPLTPEDFAKIHNKWGIDPEHVMNHGVCRAVTEDEVVWLYFPVGKHWQLRAWSEGCKSRYLMKSKPEPGLVWKSWPGTDKREVVIIVEGVMDAIRLSAVGDSVAIFGSDVNDARVESIRALGNRYVIMLDGDAMKQALTLQSKLGILESRVVMFDEDKDPTDYSDKELKSRLHTVTLNF